VTLDITVGKLFLLFELRERQSPEGYSYSRFRELCQRWRRKQDVVLRQVHKPGETKVAELAALTTSLLFAA
jgi:hypothetical protein